MNTRNKNRVKLILITCIFALPVLTAIYVSNNTHLLEGGSTKNYGTLISPAIPTVFGDYFVIENEDDVAHLKGRWMIWHLDLDGRCDEACEKSVHILRQLNVLLNKDSDRLKRVYLEASGEASDIDLSKDKKLNIFTWTAAQQLKLKALVNDLSDGDILLLDPLGNLMMKYQQDADPYGIQKDLKHLFKASQIG